MITTLMCDLGHHGGADRRGLAKVGWEGMYEGRCAGTVVSIGLGLKEQDCECACHLAIDPVAVVAG